MLLAGEKTPRGWASGKAAAFDAYDAKAEALALLEAAGAPVGNLMVMGEAGPQFHPGQSATLRLGPKKVLARFGMLHPATLARSISKGPVVRPNCTSMRSRPRRAPALRPPLYAPPALQAVTRDFAFLVDAACLGPPGARDQGRRQEEHTSVPACSMTSAARASRGPEVLAIEVTLQPGEKSYTEEAAQGGCREDRRAAAKLGAELRH